jgi:hypothetical protein
MPDRESRQFPPDTLTDIASLSILQLIYLLKPGQLWGLLIVLFGLLSGSFGLGYKISSLVTEVDVVRYRTESAGLREQIELVRMASKAEVERYKTETASLHDKIKQFRAIQTKERFLALYLRYLIAKSALASEDSEENREAVQVAGDNLSTYITKLLARGDEASEEIDLRGLFLGKTGGKKATVKFGYDGSVWDVPPEFGFAAKR